MCVFVLYCFFFFKQKTAYEMRISDWSSDVCSSDLPWQKGHRHHQGHDQDQERLVRHTPTPQPTNVAMKTLNGELPSRLNPPMQATAARAAISLLRVLHSETST